MQRVRFMHIPKTAGNSFNSVLFRQYGRSRYFMLNGERIADAARFEALPPSRRTQISLFAGHAPITTGLPEADSARIITLLRDPVKRVKSFCQHVSEGKAAYLLYQFPAEAFSLDQFLASGNRELSNLQTKYLSGEFLVGNGAINVRESSTEKSDSELLDLALANLKDRLCCFGLQEHFEESLIAFATKLGWRRMPTYYFQNKKSNKHRIDFTERHLERIVELNALDIKLYEKAKEVFFNHLDSGDFDRQKLAKLRNWQRLPSIIRRATTLISTGEY